MDREFHASRRPGDGSEFTGLMLWPSGAPGSTWEHGESQWSNLRKTSLGTLLVRLEIIATTHRSTIFKTHVFSLYSHLCIYIATHLHTVYLDWLQAVLEGNSRCAWKWWLTELRHTLRGRHRASLEIHFEAVIKRVWRCTLRPWSSKFVDAIGGRDCANMEAVFERLWRCNLRPWSNGFGDALWGRDRANLEMQLDSMNVWI